MVREFAATEQCKQERMVKTDRHNEPSVRA